MMMLGRWVANVQVGAESSRGAKEGQLGSYAIQYRKKRLDYNTEAHDVVLGQVLMGLNRCQDGKSFGSTELVSFSGCPGSAALGLRAR
jgi:hypothetical protein